MGHILNKWTESRKKRTSRTSNQMKIGPNIRLKTVLLGPMVFCFFSPLVTFWSSGFLFIRSSGFGQLYQLGPVLALEKQVRFENGSDFRHKSTYGLHSTILMHFWSCYLFGERITYKTFYSVTVIYATSFSSISYCYNSELVSKRYAE